MTGLYLFLGLFGGGSLIGGWVGYALAERLDRSPAQRECDQLADRDLAAGR